MKTAARSRDSYARHGGLNRTAVGLARASVAPGILDHLARCTLMQILGSSTFNIHNFVARGIRSTESKGFNTEKQARITESTEQKRIWALRAVGGRAPLRHHSYLRARRDPRLFLRVGFVAFRMRPGCGRAPISLAPDRSPGRLPRAKSRSTRNRTNDGPRMPGQIQNV
jgi:hypothetical protein